MKKWIPLVLLVCLWSFPVSAASLTASVNRNPVPLGETFVLTVKYDENPQNQQPDFSVLDKDFVTYSAGSSFRSNYINGKFTQFYQWELVLMPKAAGEMTIPALKLGKAQSRPINLTVSDALPAPAAAAASNPQATAAAAADSPKFSFVGVLDNPHPLVQQQINYTVTLKTTVAVQGNPPQFEDDGSGSWIVRALGQPEVTSSTVNGVEVREIKFNYALFPQKSGQLVIPPVQFEGYYVTYDDNAIGRPGSLFNDVFSFSSMFGQRRPVLLRTKPVSIEVGKIPAANNGNWWLPAQKVVLGSDWERQMPEFKSGEAVKREIYLQADGAVDSQLPHLDFAEIPGVKQYPEKPQYASEVRNGKLVSLMKVTNVYIPENPGRIVIPEIAVSWYNIDKNRMEKAVLPAVEARVWPGKETKAAAAAVVPVPAATENPPAVMGGQTPAVPAAGSPYLLWLAIGGAFGLGIALSYFWFRPRVAAAVKADAPACTDIQLAIRNNNLHEIRDSVLAWGRQQYGAGNIRNLGDVAARVGNPEFSARLNELSRALYSGKTADFDSREFAALFQKISKKNETNGSQKEKLLPDLYK